MELVLKEVTVVERAVFVAFDELEHMRTLECQNDVGCPPLPTRDFPSALSRRDDSPTISKTVVFLRRVASRRFAGGSNVLAVRWLQ